MPFVPTYLEFLAAFVLAPIAALLAAARLRRHTDARGLRPGGLAIIVALAVVYTVPWDNYLVARGVWTYGDGLVAATIGAAPLGEYLFIVLQPVLTALWLARLPAGWERSDPAPLATDGGSTMALLRARLAARSLTALGGRALARGPRALAVACAAAVGLIGVGLLTRPWTFYLGAILAWAAPVLALQWGVGAPQLWRRRRTVAVGVLVPTAYLWAADRLALAAGVWALSPQYTTGIAIAGLPVEEAVFFLVTNLFVVQGLVLYRWVIRRWP